MEVGYYAVIPANVRYNKNLTANSKLLYGELTALANQNGYCWATNAYFSELYGVDERSIQNWLKALEQEGFIFRALTKKGELLEERKIYIASTPPEKIFTPHEKNFRGGTKKISPPHEKNFTQNNTKNNTFNNSKRNIKEKETIKSICEEFADTNKDLLEALLGFIEMRKGQKTNLTPRALKLNLNKLKELSQDPEEQIKIINTSVMNGWKSFYLTNETKPKQTKSSQQEYFDKVDMWAKEIEEEQKNGPSGLHEYY